eukprot:GHVT01023608.1.p1 GENE.GHVT01023608.1~~GHVT01023608.1.p1  ORF type:complete len:204 (-),score=42.39 GHVT01023608.1:196-807(-)
MAMNLVKNRTRSFLELASIFVCKEIKKDCLIFLFFNEKPKTFMLAKTKAGAWHSFQAEVVVWFLLQNKGRPISRKKRNNAGSVLHFCNSLIARFHYIRIENSISNLFWPFILDFIAEILLINAVFSSTLPFRSFFLLRTPIHLLSSSYSSSNSASFATCSFSASCSSCSSYSSFSSSSSSYSSSSASSSYSSSSSAFYFSSVC